MFSSGDVTVMGDANADETESNINRTDRRIAGIVVLIGTVNVIFKQKKRASLPAFFDSPCPLSPAERGGLPHLLKLKNPLLACKERVVERSYDPVSYYKIS
jgi:hypothetical protein